MFLDRISTLILKYKVKVHKHLHSNCKVSTDLWSPCKVVKTNTLPNSCLVTHTQTHFSIDLKLCLRMWQLSVQYSDFFYFILRKIAGYSLCSLAVTNLVFLLFDTVQVVYSRFIGLFHKSWLQLYESGVCCPQNQNNKLKEATKLRVTAQLGDNSLSAHHYEGPLLCYTHTDTFFIIGKKKRLVQL